MSQYPISRMEMIDQVRRLEGTLQDANASKVLWKMKNPALWDKYKRIVAEQYLIYEDEKMFNFATRQLLKGIVAEFKQTDVQTAVPQKEREIFGWDHTDCVV